MTGNMTEGNDPVKTLLAAKDKLVEERRALAVAIALGYRRRRTDDIHTNEMRETFVAIQETIEAIDRAIVHEKVTGRQDEAVSNFDTVRINAAVCAQA